jgi:acetylornithine deacetylase/succinyl-diaminopimelate desuccinylase-like protein
MTGHQAAERVLARVDADRDELVALAADLIRIPSVNPPGDGYRECAELIGRRLDLMDLVASAQVMALTTLNLVG